MVNSKPRVEAVTQHKDAITTHGSEQGVAHPVALVAARPGRAPSYPILGRIDRLTPTAQAAIIRLDTRAISSGG